MIARLLLALLLTTGAPARASDIPFAAPAIATTSLHGYDAVRARLVADDLTGTAAAARALAASDPALAPPATAVAEAVDLAAMRVAFGELSRAVALGLGSAAPPAKVWAYRCPMVGGYGYWLQTSAGLANPYMGQAMPACGEGVALKAAIKAAAP
ncbi:MAG: hypothetical protein V4850_23460 [Myxococcota bacterium]